MEVVVAAGKESVGLFLFVEPSSTVPGCGPLQPTSHGRGESLPQTEVGRLRRDIGFDFMELSFDPPVFYTAKSL
jgi:hypothetical protein